jgi:hypothetical protein
MRLVVRGFALGLMVLLAACVSRHKAEGHGKSPAYAAGYTDGCATASARANGEVGGEARDAGLYKANADYRAGWRAGYGGCVSTMPPNPLDNPFGKPPGT